MAASRRTARQAELEHRIRDAIAELRPLIPIDPCGLELVEFRVETGILVLRIEGDCPDCDLTAATFIQGIEANLRLRIPEIREVRTGASPLHS
jgi:Fe-S cluster biogenesis protein NfuA